MFNLGPKIYTTLNHNTASWVAFPYFGAWKHSCLALQVSSLHWCYFTLIFTPPEQFAPHFHLEAGLSKCLFLSVNYTQYHFRKVNSPQMRILSPHPPMFRNTVTRSQSTCVRACVLYLSLCWANTLLCLSCYLCHDDERHLLFSAESPLHPS